MSYYFLDGKIPKPVSLMEWVIGFRPVQVANELINGVQVSTVFLGLDYQFRNGGPPILFETMTFDGIHDQIVYGRYCTWEEAEIGHAEAVKHIKKVTTPGPAPDSAFQF